MAISSEYNMALWFVILCQGFDVAFLPAVTSPSASENQCPPGYCHDVKGSCTVPMETLSCKNAGSVCSGHGVCISFGSTYRCVCDQHTTGSRCQLPFLPSNPGSCDNPDACLNGGNCYETHSGCICSCPPGFHGNRCEKKTRTYTYENDICENGGTSYRYGHEIACVCPCGFLGQFCDRPLYSGSTRRSTARETEQTTEPAGRCSIRQSEDPCTSFTCGADQTCEMDRWCSPVCSGGDQSSSVASVDVIVIVFGSIGGLAIIFLCVCILYKMQVRNRDHINGNSLPVVFTVSDTTSAPDISGESVIKLPSYDEVCGHPPAYDDIIMQDDRNVHRTPTR